MASVAMASVSSTMTLTLSKDELRQIDEYGKIINFRERVLSGKHPNIKVPAHLLAAKASNASPTTTLSSTSAPVDDSMTNAISSFHINPSSSRKASGLGATENREAFQANSSQSSLITSFPGLGSLLADPGSCSTPASAKTFGSARAEINPIFLEKSDHLIKTELQLQRQRVERSLREQLEQRRNTSWSLQPSEPLPDFDLMDVLQQALVLAQKTASSHADGNVAANNSDAESLEGNAYASTYIDDSPNSNHLARLPDGHEPEDVDMRESSDYEPELSFTSEPAAPLDNRASMPGNMAFSAKNPSSAVGGQHAQNAIAAAQRPPSPRIQDTAVHIVSSGESADASGSADSGNTDNEQSADDRTKSIASARLAQAYGAGISTVVRAHDLSPVAPQPSHVSPLAIAGAPQLSDTRRARATPAQVIAIRNEVSAASSPESSPQGSKVNEKRKGKKKNKRKADRPAADATPYIKAEPRSPSPFSALPAGRPHKRLRPSHRSMEQLNYDEARSQQVRREMYRDQNGNLSYGEENPRVVYERRDISLREGPASGHANAQPYDREVYEIRRPVSTQFSRDPDAAAPYPIQYNNEPRLRPVSQAAVDRSSHREVPVYYHDLRDEPRISARPGNGRDRSPSPIMRETRPAAMAPPPRVQPTRIIVDEYGREYIEPSRPDSVARHSVAATATAEPLVYDPHVPGRAVSMMAEAYGDNIIYRRPLSPQFQAPRRVITEPEYAAGEYRSYRSREYSVVPQGSTAGDDYVRGRPPPERRVVDNLPREYITRSNSVRPAETVRYEVAGGYGERYGSVRPDMPVREYNSGVYPDSRREVVYQQPYAREFSVRPEVVAQRSYSVRPPDAQQFQYERPVRSEADVPYLERPRGAPEGATYEDALRGVYR